MSLIQSVGGSTLATSYMQVEQYYYGAPVYSYIVASYSLILTLLFLHYIVASYSLILTLLFLHYIVASYLPFLIHLSEEEILQVWKRVAVVHGNEDIIIIVLHYIHMLYI